MLLRLRLSLGVLFKIEYLGLDVVREVFHRNESEGFGLLLVVLYLSSEGGVD
jgi:hypothetical protein